MLGIAALTTTELFMSGVSTAIVAYSLAKTGKAVKLN